MPIDINSFVAGGMAGGYQPGSASNYGVSSWRNGGGGNWNYSTSTPPGTTRQPTQAAKASQTFNLGSVGDIDTLTKSLNDLNQQAQKTALAGRIPNNPALENQSSINILSKLKGQVPQDVLDRLAQSAAERGVQSGIDPTSPNANAAYLRALGITSLDLTKEGQNELTAADARNPIAPIVDASKYTLTPKESADINLAYLTEADRTALENARIAAEGARGGYRGGGGYGGGGPTLPNNDWGFQEPGIGPVGRAPNIGITGGNVLPANDYTTQQWLNSIGYTPQAFDYSRYGEGAGLPRSNTFGAGAQAYPDYNYDPFYEG